MMCFHTIQCCLSLSVQKIVANTYNVAILAFLIICATVCMQYTSSSMVKIWQAAGLDLSNANPAAVGKMPMSAPQ
jgi:TRAP-type C4-dicarboxylate transport system permease small subunit